MEADNDAPSVKPYTIESPKTHKASVPEGQKLELVDEEIKDQTSTFSGFIDKNKKTF
jgi:hypothetical protein